MKQMNEEEKKRLDVKFHPIRNRYMEDLAHRIHRILIAVLVLILLVAAVVIADFSGYALEDVKALFAGEASQLVDELETAESSVSSQISGFGSMYAGHSFVPRSLDQMLNRQSHHNIYAVRDSQTTQSVGNYGIDVSEWQQKIDWAEVVKDTIPHRLGFSIAKATQGADSVDSEFVYNWKNMKGAFDLAGAYHFYIYRDNPEQQAQNFIQTVSLEEGDLPPIVDIEYNCSKCDGLAISQQQMIRALDSYLSVVASHYGVKPILYTDENFYNKYLRGSFGEYTFWMAKYSNTPPPGMELAQSTDSDSTRSHQPFVAIWQFTDYERIKGITGRVDMNFLPAQAKDSLELVK